MVTVKRYNFSKLAAFTLLGIALIIAIVIVGNQRLRLGKNEVIIDSLKWRTQKLNIDLGKTLFRADCSMCHVAKYKTDNLMEGIVNRIGENYLRKYLTKQDSLLNAKDKYALALKESWGNLANSHNFKYSDEELNALIQYLKD
jgi:cytochrome c1